jgi:glycosyltransferase involved in cell wall biosynthesis
MEANPASTLEANACGLPVVAPKVGSLIDTVEHGVTGLLCKPNDIEALSQAILEILTKDDRGAEMGIAARAKVCREFSLEVMVQGYENLIEGVYSAAQCGDSLLPATFDQIMEDQLSGNAAIPPVGSLN